MTVTNKITRFGSIICSSYFDKISIDATFISVEIYNRNFENSFADMYTYHEKSLCLLYI